MQDSFFLSPLCQSGPKQTEGEPDWRESKGRQTVTGQSQEACGSVKVATSSGENSPPYRHPQAVSALTEALHWKYWCINVFYILTKTINLISKNLPLHDNH